MMRNICAVNKGQAACLAKHDACPRLFFLAIAPGLFFFASIPFDTTCQTTTLGVVESLPDKPSRARLKCQKLRSGSWPGAVYWAKSLYVF